MSLYGVMRTGGSGMNAQSNKLATVADNIANVNTTGYKRASTEFSSRGTPDWLFTIIGASSSACAGAATTGNVATARSATRVSPAFIRRFLADLLFSPNAA